MAEVFFHLSLRLVTNEWERQQRYTSIPTITNLTYTWYDFDHRRFASLVHCISVSGRGSYRDSCTYDNRTSITRTSYLLFICGMRIVDFSGVEPHRLQHYFCCRFRSSSRLLSRDNDGQRPHIFQHVIIYWSNVLQSNTMQRNENMWLGYVRNCCNKCNSLW